MLQLTRKKHIDIIWFIEHIARELDVACAVTCIAQKKYGLNIQIRNMYLQADEATRSFQPKVVVHPFLYFVSGAIATESFVEKWPKAIHFNLAWEELFYKAHEQIKAPSDFFARKIAFHHAWGDFFKHYLVKHGVPINHIFVNGNPAYQLYKYPYNKFYKTRDSLSKKYDINPHAKWVFFPENYRWAFVDQKIDLFVKLGSNKNEILQMRDFSLESLKQALAWCNETAQNQDIQFIFRPRPATHSKVIQSFFEEHIGTRTSNFHIIKDESVREWILASDVVTSSYSTTLIEAAIAGKPIFMIEPLPTPASLQYDWFRYVPRVCSSEAFTKACLKPPPDCSSALKKWAETEMLANGDPVEGLASTMKHLIDAAPPTASASHTPSLLKRLKVCARPVFSFGGRKHIRGGHNPNTHENDFFTDDDVRDRIAAWYAVLFSH